MTLIPPLYFKPMPDDGLYPEDSIDNIVDADWCFVAEGTPEELQIRMTRKEVTKIAEQLHAQQSPLNSLLDEMMELIAYEQTDYKILYINKEGKLDHYFPKSPYGHYYYGEDVLKFISDKLSYLYGFYEKQRDENKWKVLKVARRLIPSLEKIISNYSTSASYQSFTESITAHLQALNTFISEQSRVLNSFIDSYIPESRMPTIYDYLGLYADSYPESMIYHSMKHHYGERLTDLAFKEYLTTSSEKDPRLYYDEVYSLLFVIATNVKREDLEWKYNEWTKETDSPSFNELKQNEIDELIRHFRRAPDGHNLLDYFGIPISLDKNVIELSYQNYNPAVTLEEQKRMNEMHVYADIESSKIWHTGRVIQMCDIQMYDQLNTLFQDPYNGQLFHTDRYISFLNVAATAIAYYQSCEGNPEAIDAKMPRLITLLEEIVNHAKEMYPKDYVEDYKTQWLTLIGRLKDAMNDPKCDFTRYFLSLFTHPLQSYEEQQNTLQYYYYLQPYEFLARKVAYWNRYYLSNSLFLDEEERLKNPSTCDHRIGTLFYLSDHKWMRLYEVKDLVIKDGFACQICTPYHPESYVAAKKPIPLKICFQGTILNTLSIHRDKNYTGAGYDLWEQETTSLVIPNIHNLMKSLREKYGEETTFNLSFIGHSLGGSDAQNAASYLSEMLLSRSMESSWIHHINIHTFNTAGVPNETVTRFNNNYTPYLDKIGRITHSLVKNDIVSKTAQTKVGKEFKQPEKLAIIEISNLGVFNFVTNHCDYIYSWTDSILPHKLLDSEKDQEMIKRYLSGLALSWSHLKAHTHDLLKETPITRIAFGALSFVTVAFIGYQLQLMGEGLLLAGGALLTPGVKLATDESNSMTKTHMKQSVAEIWDACTKQWYGTQVLEGTG